MNETEIGIYRKKPVLVRAAQFDAANAGPFLAIWCGGKYYNDFKPLIQIKTLEGTMTAFIGDWIIRGIKGEFYPCKPDIFEATYELNE